MPSPTKVGRVSGLSGLAENAFDQPPHTVGRVDGLLEKGRWSWGASSRLLIGWEQYRGSDPIEMWVDDVAVGKAPIVCPPRSAKARRSQLRTAAPALAGTSCTISP
jgi:hypothetical protein